MADKLSERLEAAREALDSMDDLARMEASINPIGPRKVLEDFIEAAAELARRVEDDELEVAVAQAVEFAEYVERQAKGTMRDAAKRFLSLPYSQEIAEHLKERDALARDAERYRWLRENPHVRVDQFGGKYRASTAAQILTDWLSSYDEAIDAAIASANGSS